MSCRRLGFLCTAPWRAPPVAVGGQQGEKASLHGSEGRGKEGEEEGRESGASEVWVYGVVRMISHQGKNEESVVKRLLIRYSSGELESPHLGKSHATPAF